MEPSSQKEGNVSVCLPVPVCRSNIPFDKEELNAILKFGAAGLFGEGGGDGAGDKALQEMDIDDILRRAETQVAVEDTCSVADELLSQVRMSLVRSQVHIY